MVGSERPQGRSAIKNEDVELPDKNLQRRGMEEASEESKVGQMKGMVRSGPFNSTQLSAGVSLGRAARFVAAASALSDARHRQLRANRHTYFLTPR